MGTIKLITAINAPIDRCFDVARDIDIHQISTQKTNERAIAGRTSGLCQLNDEITWEASHFWIRQKLTSKITQMSTPYFFEDIMIRGAFKSMEHQHYFEENKGITYMKDVFSFKAPFGLIGLIFDKLILKRYMTQFLITRNNVLKSIAEKA